MTTSLLIHPVPRAAELRLSHSDLTQKAVTCGILASDETCQRLGWTQGKETTRPSSMPSPLLVPSTWPAPPGHLPHPSFPQKKACPLPSASHTADDSPAWGGGGGSCGGGALAPACSSQEGGRVGSDSGSGPAHLVILGPTPGSQNCPQPPASASGAPNP